MSLPDTDLDRRWREGLTDLSAAIDVDDAPRRVADRVAGRRRRRRVATAIVSVVVLAGVASVAFLVRDDGTDVTPAEPPVDATPVRVEAGNFLLTPVPSSVPAGPVEIELVNVEGGLHVLVIEGVDDFELQVEGAGDRAVGTVDLEPGTYTLEGDVPGHHAAGEEATLLVTGR